VVGQLSATLGIDGHLAIDHELRELTERRRMVLSVNEQGISRFEVPQAPRYRFKPAQFGEDSDLRRFAG